MRMPRSLMRDLLCGIDRRMTGTQVSTINQIRQLYRYSIPQIRREIKNRSDENRLFYTKFSISSHCARKRAGERTQVRRKAAEKGSKPERRKAAENSRKPERQKAAENSRKPVRRKAAEKWQKTGAAESCGKQQQAGAAESRGKRQQAGAAES